jgi:hypothetical protein
VKGCIQCHPAKDSAWIDELVCSSSTLLVPRPPAVTLARELSSSSYGSPSRQIQLRSPPFAANENLRDPAAPSNDELALGCQHSLPSLHTLHPASAASSGARYHAPLYALPHPRQSGPLVLL